MAVGLLQRFWERGAQYDPHDPRTWIADWHAIPVLCSNEPISATAASVHSRREVLFTNVRRHITQMKNIEVSIG